MRLNQANMAETSIGKASHRCHTTSKKRTRDAPNLLSKRSNYIRMLSSEHLWLDGRPEEKCRLNLYVPAQGWRLRPR